MSRGRSTSPRPLNDGGDIDMDTSSNDKAKVVIITNLTRNVAEAHLQTIFGFYGQITKIDLPLFAKSGQNRGKAALEYSEPDGAHKAASHMNGGQLDGAILKVELSNLPGNATGVTANGLTPVHCPVPGPGHVLLHQTDIEKGTLIVVEDLGAEVVVVEGIFIVVVAVVGHVQGHLFAEGHGDVHRVILGEVMVVCAGQGRGVIQCAPVVPVPALCLVRVLVHVLVPARCPTLHTPDTVEVEVVLVQSPTAGEGGA
ncbi:hypothetical protein D9758_001275 [Tetrapyrgos nigripes]|uniref:RRM domain-containing protein n=1 Tax=Tetrapyrgos nigripes TaxID=182062 RepID=A0A8H5GRP6_9AGAR|nr:hypothetical protein D9758_001275 [Tetrapyrgos nigripes]